MALYFDVAPRKMLLFGGLTALLISLVGFTLASKSTFYGDSTFAQVFEYVTTGAYKNVLYTIRAKGPSNLLASTVAYKKTDPQELATAIPVLTYHAIVNAPNDESVSPESFEGHNVSLENFEDQMFTLKKAGWQTITFEDYEAFMQGERMLPERSFLLTFDDGAKQSYYPVDPLLKALDYTAVTFILPAFSQGEGSYYYLSQGELARMIESGRWEVESHGEHIHTFAPIDESGDEGAALANRLWLPDEHRLETMDEYTERIRDDLATSKQKLEAMFGTPVKAFAYPFGDFGQLSKNNPEAIDIVKQAVSDTYDFSFHQWWNGFGYTYNYPPGNVYVRRISVQPAWTGQDLLQFLELGKPKKLPFEDTFTADQGWLSTWGKYQVENDALSLGAEPTTSGASVILDGSGSWENYRVHMELESPAQTGVFVWVRFADNDNNAACNLGNGFSHVEQVVNGSERVIKGGKSDVIIPQGIFSIDISVNDRFVSCSMNGQELVSTEFLDPALARGGIGIKTWDKELGKSSVIVRKLEVTPLGGDEDNALTASLSPHL
jgi:peptidoglycan/xylan/chitin deacetylase (PgdA/CDA1 family)